MIGGLIKMVSSFQLLEFDNWRSGHDLLAGRYHYLFHYPRPVCAKYLLHLHGFEDADGIAGDDLVSGIDLSGEYSFFMLYFAMTGIHLAHVILGILVLLIALNLSRKEQPIRYLKFVECSAIFWHMVDLLWLVIFALLYVIR